MVQTCYCASFLFGGSGGEKDHRTSRLEGFSALPLVAVACRESCGVLAGAWTTCRAPPALPKSLRRCGRDWTKDGHFGKDRVQLQIRLRSGYGSELAALPV